jgi:hypothetical protein
MKGGNLVAEMVVWLDGVWDDLMVETKEKELALEKGCKLEVEREALWGLMLAALWVMEKVQMTVEVKARLLDPQRVGKLALSREHG